MATLPSQETYVAGNTLLASQLNSDVRDAGNFFLNVPQVKVYNSANWTNFTASGTFVQVTWDSEAYDTDTMHSTASNQARITFTTAGIYAITANPRWLAPGAAWSSNARLQIELRKNAGATVVYEANYGPPNANNAVSAPSWSTRLLVVAGDYIEAWVAITDTGQTYTISNGLAGTEKDSFMTACWTGTG